jgi:hypothetical protein
MVRFTRGFYHLRPPTGMLAACWRIELMNVQGYIGIKANAGTPSRLPVPDLSTRDYRPSVGFEPRPVTSRSVWILDSRSA